jgi:GNAT superfamily N-acetyltransferase
VEGDVLAGAVVLYLGRGGEVAFFAREQGKGVGSELLRIIEGVGAERGLRSLWAWVLRTNTPARKTFLKNGYIIEGETEKSHKGSSYWGYQLKKGISPGRADREETGEG